MLCLVQQVQVSCSSSSIQSSFIVTPSWGFLIVWLSLSLALTSRLSIFQYLSQCKSICCRGGGKKVTSSLLFCRRNKTMTSCQKIHHPSFSPSINRFDGVYQLFLGSEFLNQSGDNLKQLKYNVEALTDI